MERVRLTIKGWSKFNPRTDVKRPSWFRLENSLFEDTELFDLSNAEKIAWIYILCCASKRNTDTIIVNYNHAKQIGRIEARDLRAAIEKLQRLQVIHVHVTDTYADVTDSHATNVRTNETNVRTNTIAQSEIERVYQEYPRKIGKGLGLKKLRSQIKTEQDLAELKRAVTRFREHHERQKTEPQFVPYFSTFVSQWRDWIDPLTGSAEQLNALDISKILNSREGT